ncbi:MAG: hypothetical protein AAFN78_07240 [Pseudomonadota bacterium]
MGGLLFGDLYHIPNHHLPEGDGATGAVLRRGYLTFNARSENRWFGRIRFEANQSGEFETYDYEVDFKDAYVGYKGERHELMIGLQPAFTFDVIESVWSLRYLMRTPADLQGSPSRDTGISLKGKINDAWSYRAMVGAGAEFGAESGDGQNTMAALNWKLNDQWQLDFYMDYEKRPGNADNTTAQVFAGYQGNGLRFGAQYLYRDRESEPRAELASTFLVKSVGERSRLIGRIDRILEPSPKGNNISFIPFDPSARATMFLAGYEYTVNDHFRMTPNTIVISYDRNDLGVRPDTDFFLRLTLFMDFE